MGRNNARPSRSENQGVTTSDAKHLQAELYNLCHQAMSDAKAEGKIQASLITAVNNVIKDAGVTVSSSSLDNDHPLWKLVENTEDLQFTDFDRY